MKALLLALTLALSPLAALSAPSDAPLMCDFNGSTFRVFDGRQTFEKYVGSVDSSSVKIECSSEIGAALLGSHLIVFSDGVFTDKYIGSVDPDTQALKVSEKIAVAFSGSYMFAARSGQKQIVDKYLGSTSEPVTLAMGFGVAVAHYGSYFLATDGTQIQDKYLGNVDKVDLVATGNIGGGIMGSYFLAYVDGRIMDKYMGSSTDDDFVDAYRDLIASSFGSYFVVLDGVRREIRSEYVGGGGGRVDFVGDSAVFTPYSGGARTSYSLATGQFSRF